MDDKKKTLVVAALFVIILAVGAFQLTGGSSEPAANAAPEAKKSENKADQEAEDPIKNQDVSAPLARRDPFAPDTLPDLPDPIPAPTPPPRAVPQPTPLPGIPPVNPGDFGPFPGGLADIEPPKPDVFSYSLAGIVLGDRPAALFVDGAGNQHLVREGASIDGDARLVSIAHGRVTVSYKGEKQTLKLGGNPSGN